MLSRCQCPTTNTPRRCTCDGPERLGTCTCIERKLSLVVQDHQAHMTAVAATPTANPADPPPEWSFQEREYTLIDEVCQRLLQTCCSRSATGHAHPRSAESHVTSRNTCRICASYGIPNMVLLPSPRRQLRMQLPRPSQPSQVPVLPEYRLLHDLHRLLL